MKDSNMVEHPKHYNNASIECIDAMLELFGVEATKDFCLLNSFKYLWRHEAKNGVEDIKKANWYLNKYLELEKDGDTRTVKIFKDEFLKLIKFREDTDLEVPEWIYNFLSIQY